MSSDAADRFLDEAADTGLLSEWQVDAVRHVADVLAEVQVELSSAEICVRKGFLTAEQAGDVERRLAQRRVAKYEVLERLGSGGAGVVWRARDTALGRIVALKLLSSRVRTSPAFEERFLREARIAVRLSHVNLVRGLDFGEADGYRYFAMEFVPGRSLAERLAEDFKLREDEVVEVALQVVDALDYVQQFQLVHRDLKPDNLLLTPTGRVKVCDFGLAKPTTTEAAVDAPDGHTAGTPAYMSPEQIRAPATVDWRSDVYSLGATLYHALTGQPPFDPTAGRSVIHAHLEEVPPDPREVALDVSAGIAAVLLKMLRKRPEDRYSTLAQLREDLEAVRDGRPPVHTVTFARRLGDTAEVEIVSEGRPTTRSGAVRVAAWVGVLVACAGLVQAALSIWSPFASDRPEEHARVRPEPAADRSEPKSDDTPSEARAPARSERPRRRIDARDEERAALSFGSIEPLLDGGEEELARASTYLDAWLSEYRDTTLGERVRAAREEVRGRLRVLAERELEERRSRAVAAAAEGNYAEAYRLLRDFPATLRDTPAAEQAAELAERRLRELETRTERWLTEVDAALARFDLAEARSLHALADRNRTAGTRSAIERLGRLLEATEGERERRRVEHLADYVGVRGRALLTAGEAGVTEARAYAAEQFGRPELQVFVEERKLLASDLDLLERLLVAALPEVVPEAVSSQLLLERLARDPERLVAAAEQVSGGDDVAGERARLLFHVSLGDLNRAWELQSSVEEGHERVEAVRTLLEAQVDELLAVVERDLTEERPAECARRLDEATALLPDYAPTALLRGRLALSLSRPEEALVEFERALEIPETGWWLGRTLAELERPAEARDVLERATDRLGPEHPLRPLVDAELERVTAQLVLAELGPLRRRVRQARAGEHWGEVMALTARILELVPDDDEALYWRGQAASERGGRHVFDAWIALRELAERRGGRFRSSARHRLERLEEEYSGVSQVALGLVHQATVALDAGRLTSAAELFGRALDTSPFLEVALRGAAETLLATSVETGEAERARDARRAFERTLLRHPDSLEARVGLAASELVLRRPAEAARIAEQVLEEHAEHAEALRVAADAWLQADDASRSLALYEQLHEVQPGPQPLLGQARALESMGRLAAARDRLLRLSDGFGIPPELEREVEAMFARLQHAR